jgi:ribonuclease HI
MQTLTIYTDGGARGNPGPAAVGAFLQLGEWTHEHKRTIGDATNNVAEYTAVLDALTLLPEVPGEIEEIALFLDSELVVRQLLGQYRVKDATLQLLHGQAVTALRSSGKKYRITHVPRAQNARADALVNQALDGQ